MALVALGFGVARTLWASPDGVEPTTATGTAGVSAAPAPSDAPTGRSIVTDGSSEPAVGSVPSETAASNLESGEPSSPTPSWQPAPTRLSALEAVDLLETKGRAPMTGYDRDLFAYRAVDLDRNGCDVRNDILRRDLLDVEIRRGTHGCVVESGTLIDPYSGDEITFKRGWGTSGEVQIDHIVALADAWQKGAQAWSEGKLHAFGNDPLNLIATSGPLNQAKGAGDAATWLPPRKGFRCEYVARQVSVKVAYGLWVTSAEKSAIVRILEECPPMPLSESDHV